MKIRLKTSLFVLLCVSALVNFIFMYNPTETNEPKIEKHENGQPHILFIVADDLGFNDIGYHGSNVTTPNLDKLAMAGVRLENYYVQSTCTPSRAALLTGRYAIHTGVQRAYLPGQPIGMPLDNPTLADKLREAGYSTHIVGKWHLGFHKRSYLPTSRGFDSFFGFYNGFSDYFSHISRHRYNIKGFDLVENEIPVNWTKYDGYYSTDLFADKSIDIIRKHDTQKPLFMYLSFQAVHSPVQAPTKYIKQKGNSNPKVRDIYEGMVASLDDAVGRVVEVMKEEGLWENTVLVFTTDNGGPEKTGASNWPLKGFKGSGWEGGVRAVGFVHSNLLSDKVTGTVSKELMHITDWFPTFLNLAGGNLNVTKPLDGVDQWKSLKYGMASQRKEILHDILPTDSPGEPLPNETLSITNLRRASIRIGPWKIMKEFLVLKQVVKGVSLFNIEKDPTENNDVSKEFPDIVKQMLERLDFYHKSTVPSPNPVENPLANPRLRRGFWEPWQD